MFYYYFFFYFFYYLLRFVFSFLFFFFNDTATTEIYTLSLHDALPIWPCAGSPPRTAACSCTPPARSEEHTSELQSRSDLVCRLLLEKKKTNPHHTVPPPRLGSHPPTNPRFDND